MAVEALRAGAFDFITKPIALEQLSSVLDRAVQQRRSKSGIVRLEDPEILDGSRHGLIGSSKVMRQVMERISRVAPTDATYSSPARAVRGRSWWPAPCTLAAHAVKVHSWR
jgi:two-component system response regulator HydG